MIQVLDGHYQAEIHSSIMAGLNEQRAPSMLLRPKLFPDGDQWCALYGDDLQSGVAGFGKTPREAYFDFDRAWDSLPAPKVARPAEATKRASPGPDDAVAILMEGMRLIASVCGGAAAGSAAENAEQIANHYIAKVTTI